MGLMNLLLKIQDNNLGKKESNYNIFVRKNRNWPVGQIDLRFENKFMRFYDLAQDNINEATDVTFL